MYECFQPCLIKTVTYTEVPPAPLRLPEVENLKDSNPLVNNFFAK